MKNFITMAVSLFSLTMYAQVGINNNTPKATLDITAKTTDGSKPEGLIAPRLTGDQIQAGDASTGLHRKELSCMQQQRQQLRVPKQQILPQKGITFLTVQHGRKLQALLHRETPRMTPG